MADDKCAFNDPILNGGFGCRNASPVARRAGPDIACGSPTLLVPSGKVYRGSQRGT